MGCAFPVITTMALWKLMHLDIWCTSCAQVYELPQSHCGDDEAGALFSGLHIYCAELASVRFEFKLFRRHYTLYLGFSNGESN